MAGLVVAGVFGPIVAPFDPTKVDLSIRLMPPAGFGGSWAHPLGTDGLGRDIFSGILHGARISLVVGLGATALAATVGVGLGTLAGFRGGVWDSIVSGVVDAQLAFPGLLLVILVNAYLGEGILTVTVTLALVSWMVFARMARSQALSLRGREFVDAAELSGSSPVKTMLRHLLPNMISPLTTLALLEVARLMLAESGLSYLGFGIQPPDVSWGLMVAEGQQYIRQSWWVVTLPGLMIVLAVVAFNLLSRSASPDRPAVTRMS